MYAIYSIAIHSVTLDDDDDDVSILYNPEYKDNMSHQCDVMFHPCDMTSTVSIQSLNSSALLLPTPPWHGGGPTSQYEVDPGGKSILLPSS